MFKPKVYRTKKQFWKTPKARALRNNPTPSEARLWQHIRKEKLGVRFRRQHIILGYIADFYCPNKRLVIEVDGDYHDDNREYDNIRYSRFRNIGITTLRLPNDLIMNDIDSALTIIKRRIA